MRLKWVTAHHIIMYFLDTFIAAYNALLAYFMCIPLKSEKLHVLAMQKEGRHSCMYLAFCLMSKSINNNTNLRIFSYLNYGDVFTVKLYSIHFWRINSFLNLLRLGTCRHFLGRNKKFQHMWSCAGRCSSGFMIYCTTLKRTRYELALKLHQLTITCMFKQKKWKFLWFLFIPPTGAESLIAVKEILA